MKIIKTLFDHLEKVPTLFYSMGKNKYKTVTTELFTRKDWKKLKLDEDVISNVQKKLNESKITSGPIYSLSSDIKIINEIKEETNRLNLNNVTRTGAYLDFYIKNPEVHWAFLAHLVSRNGGWNMTDIKGSLLEDLLDNDEKTNFFLFLETANWTIFNDAYPQLLLYERSKVKGKSYFHLLPQLNVSSFMNPIWEEFYHTRNSQLLTISLIINEQQHLETKVMSNPYFKEKVLNSWQYKFQELFHLTQVFFPYGSQKKIYRLAGRKVVDFTDVNNRIAVGKELYAVLFGIPKVYNTAVQFAKKVPHSGSRADYWENVYTKRPLKGANSIWHGCLKKGAPFVYSPELEKSWGNYNHLQEKTDDWFEKQDDIMKHFEEVKTPNNFDLTDDYCLGLSQLYFIDNVKKSL